MANFCGKWELLSTCGSFDNYMNQVGVSPEKQEQGRKNLAGNAKLYHDISKNGNSWVIKVITVVGEKVDTYPEGTAVDTQTLDGRNVKVTYTLEGDELVETQVGSGFTSRNVRRLNGDELTMIFTANDTVSMTRVYKRVS